MNLKHFLLNNHKLLINRTIFILFSCVINAAFARTDADELIQLLNDAHTMQATFRQYVVNNEGVHMGEESRGSIILERPGKFRWEVEKPNKQLIIINKDQLLIYDIDLSQVTKRKMNYKAQGNPAMLLSSSSETLKQLFEITKLKKTAEEIWFKLKPHTGNNYKWIKMRFINGNLMTMYIFDNFEQQTEIHFANVVINSQISKSKFEFVVPPKVDVLDEG